MAKVLVVDDEPNMRRILTVNLRRDSHVVIEAATPIDTSVLTTVLRAELYGFPGVNVRYMPLLPRNDAGKVLRQAVTATLFAARRLS